LAGTQAILTEVMWFTSVSQGKFCGSTSIKRGLLPYKPFPSASLFICLSVKLLLVLASTVILGFKSRRDPVFLCRCYVSCSLIICLPAKLLLVLASTVVLVYEFHKSHDHILLSDGSGSVHTTRGHSLSCHTTLYSPILKASLNGP
jgi:hypothetical protein